MINEIRFGIMAALALCSILGCASTAKDRFEALDRLSDCKTSPSQMDLGNSPRIGATPIKGMLDDSKCVTLSGQRTSYFSLQFYATSPTQQFEIQVFPKPRGFGFGGQHTIFLPELLLIDEVSLESVSIQHRSFFNAPGFWGTQYYFRFSLADLVPGKSYYLLVTSNNSNPGGMLFPEKLTLPYCGIADGPNPSVDVGACNLVVDSSLFVGPFGDFIIRSGYHHPNQSK